MDEAPNLRHIIIPMSWGGFVGLILGSILAFGAIQNKPAIVVGWIVGGCFIGFIISNWLIKRREDFYYYQSGAFLDTPAAQPVVDPKTNRYLDIQVWTDKTSSSWLRLGLTDEEWRGLALAIHEAQAFSTDVLDRKWYGKVKQRFEDIGLIQRGGKGGGYELTQSGRNVFKYLAMLPYPYEGVPDLIKKLDSDDGANFSPSPQVN